MFRRSVFWHTMHRISATVGQTYMLADVVQDDYRNTVVIVHLRKRKNSTGCIWTLYQDIHYTPNQMIHTVLY